MDATASVWWDGSSGLVTPGGRSLSLHSAVLQPWS